MIIYIRFYTKYVTEAAYSTEKYGTQCNQRLSLIFNILKLFLLTRERNGVHLVMLINRYLYAMFLLISHYPVLSEPLFPPSKEFYSLLLHFL